MPTLSWHCRHGQGKTVLSCPCRQCRQNWRQVKTLGDWKFRNVSSSLENFETGQNITSRNAVWTEFRLVSNLQLGLVYKRVHTADRTGQNWSVSNILRTRSPTQFTPPTRQDKTVLSCLVSGVNWALLCWKYKKKHRPTRTHDDLHDIQTRQVLTRSSIFK